MKGKMKSPTEYIPCCETIHSGVHTEACRNQLFYLEEDVECSACKEILPNHKEDCWSVSMQLLFSREFDEWREQECLCQDCGKKFVMKKLKRNK